MRHLLLFAAASLVQSFNCASAQDAPRLKSADEISRAWSATGRSSHAPVRSTTAPAVVIQNYKQIVADTAIPGGRDNNRGIEVTPVNIPQQVQVSVEVDLGSAISFDNILFKIDTAEFYDDNSRHQVQIIAEAMRKKAGVTFLVEGHTCDLGEESHNKALSDHRAARVVTELKKLGVGAERLLPLGFGETSPNFPNSSEANRQKNRRVTIYKRA